MGFPEGLWQASVGGVFLGTTATVMLAATGKLIGLSGIFDGALSGAAGRGWKVVFLSGLTAGGIAAGLLYPEGLDQSGSPSMSVPSFMISGFLVGLGTRLGNGCTSGHGLCGLSRLSRRGIAASLTFLTSGVAAASVMASCRASGGRTSSTEQETPVAAVRYIALTAAVVRTVLTLGQKRERLHWRAHLASFFCGGAFGGGLVLSGMVRRAKVIDFLALRRDSWDPSLAFVLCCGVMTAFVGFPRVVRRFGAPVCGRRANGEAGYPAALGEKFEIPTNTVVDLPLILGAWLFGVGWGTSGLCPGPAFIAATFGLPSVALAFLPSVALGMKVAGPLRDAVALPDSSWMTCGGAMGPPSAEENEKEKKK